MPEEFDVLDLTPSPRLLEVIGDLDLAPWQCIAELADNCFDDFLANPSVDPDEPSTIEVTLPTERSTVADAIVRVADNGRGMDKATLEKSLKAGYSGNDRYGRLGLFGMGFNIATARLGNRTEVWTTRAGDDAWLAVTIDLHAMQKHGSFAVPVRLEPKLDQSQHGTTVTVTELREDIVSKTKRSNAKADIRAILGDIYSFMLRDPHQFEFARGFELGGSIALNVNGIRVKPKLPCVWDERRTVTSRGAGTPAIIRVDERLSSAWACLDCGKWFQMETGTCTDCGSTRIEERERRIWGWLGVQRYLDRTQFGVDFLRQGRKILRQDKSLFLWRHPDLGDEELEYPVELPSGQGRIVGEIHLDHVNVSYRKDDFARDSRDWKTAVNLLRGEAPMKPQKAREQGYTDPNESPVARLFTAFRRNDAGLKCLIPGDTQGNGPIHEKSREWAAKFRNGEPAFQSDRIWFEAAKAFDRAQGRLVEEDDAEPTDEATRAVFIAAGLGDPFASVASSPGHVAEPVVDPSDDPVEDEPTPVQTERERFDQYRSDAERLVEISGDISIANVPSLRLECFLTTGHELRRDDGLRVPSLARMPGGGLIETYVDRDHPLFRDFGRDPRDFALLEVATVIRTQHQLTAPPQSILSEILACFPDQRLTEAALRERATDLLDQVLERLEPLVRQGPGAYWEVLSPEDKQSAERQALVSPQLDWMAAVADGSFVRYLTLSGVSTLVAEMPGTLLDGGVFSTAFATWSDPDIRRAQADRLAGDLAALDLFLRRGVGPGRDQLVRVQLTERSLRRELAGL